MKAAGTEVPLAQASSESAWRSLNGYQNDFPFKAHVAMKEIKITDIEGFKFGHAQDFEAATGCTVILCEQGAAAGVDVRGGAPGTRETDLLNPVNAVEKIHGVLLTGGSAFGLDAAAGVMQFLEEKNIGHETSVAKVPIVCGAVLFDLGLGDHRVRPDKAMGYEACLNGTDQGCSEGVVGAGTGATVGKVRGMDRCMKSGVGAYAVQVGSLKVGALAAVNCLGDVVDPRTGAILAGALGADKKSFLDTENLMMKLHRESENHVGQNTTIGVTVTNAKLTKARAAKVASMAQNGYATTIRPAHSMFDGDTVFCMATGQMDADVNVVGLLAAKTTEQAVIRAVKGATSLHGLKCYEDLRKEIET
jgi:L-aminopeptidase/D-esterase-like protein